MSAPAGVARGRWRSRCKGGAALVSRCSRWLHRTQKRHHAAGYCARHRVHRRMLFSSQSDHRSGSLCRKRSRSSPIPVLPVHTHGKTRSGEPWQRHTRKRWRPHIPCPQRRLCGDPSTQSGPALSIRPLWRKRATLKACICVHGKDKQQGRGKHTARYPDAHGTGSCTRVPNPYTLSTPNRKVSRYTCDRRV